MVRNGNELKRCDFFFFFLKKKQTFKTVKVLGKRKEKTVEWKNPAKFKQDDKMEHEENLIQQTTNSVDIENIKKKKSRTHHT